MLLQENKLQHLSKLTEAVVSGDNEVIAQELRAVKVCQETAKGEGNPELETKIQEGLLKIKEFDALLREKHTLAKRLKRTRLSLESSTTSTSSSPPPSSTSDSDSDDEPDTESVDMELKSVHSLDTRTFITEPKIGVRPRVGLE
ncbi:hypothetical protein HK097_003992, partial [Rhizophlyctis rosea]